MSYILEALSKSELARQQAAAAPKYSLLPAIGQEVTPQRWWPYALAGTLVVNAAVIYLWLPPEIPRGVPFLKEAEAVRAADVPVTPRPSGAPAAATDKPASNVESPALPEGRPHEPRAARLAEPMRVVAPAKQVRVTPPKNPSMKAPPVGAQGAQPASKAIANADAKSEAAIASAPAQSAVQSKQAAAEAPSAAQPDLPPVSVSGFIHEEGANGMVIVNDKLVREGDEVAPGLKLEKILPDGLVFNYKGYRFTR